MDTAWSNPGPQTDVAPRRVVLGLLLLICCLYSLLARDTYGGDFRAYYVAANATHAGLDPYLNQVNVDERFADRDWLEVNSRFIYPPSSLFLFAPLARLDYRLAKVVFGTAMALLMAWILLTLRNRHPSAGWVVIGLMLSLPMASNVDNGQVDVLVLALTLMVLWSRRRWLGGVCLGVAVAIKLSPVLVVLWLVARRRWATLAWAIGTAGALTAAAIGVYGKALYVEFFAHLRGHLRPDAAMLSHTFTTFKVLYGRFVVMGSNTYSLHYFYGTRQNPLLHLWGLAAPAGVVMVLAYTGWLAWRKAEEEGGFYGFLVVALFANALLWPAGLVACFPLTVWVAARSRRPVEFGLVMLIPFFVPVEFVANRRFLFWLIAVGLCWAWEWRSRNHARSFANSAAAAEAVVLAP